MADAKNRQSARARLREIQMRQRAVTAAYERAVGADEAAEEAYRAAVARAKADRAAVRQARVVALAALAATVRDQEACAEIAGAPVAEVRHAVRDADANEVERFLLAVSGPPRGAERDDGGPSAGPPAERPGPHVRPVAGAGIGADASAPAAVPS